MLFLAKYESNLIVHGFSSPSHYNGGEEILWRQNFVLHLWQNKPLCVELSFASVFTYDFNQKF